MPLKNGREDKKQRIIYLSNFEKPTCAISPAVKRNRAMNPTTSEISKKVKRNRCSELFALSEIINGASTTNKEPAVDGLLVQILW